MNRFKLFVQNFVVYGLGGTISKIVPFIMLPIVTRLMPDTTYFGLNDIASICISFGQAVAIMGMYDAMFRMFFEKEGIDYKKSICSSTLGFTVMVSGLLCGAMLLFRKPLTVMLFSSEKYLDLLTLSALNIFIGATNSIVSAPTRMNNQRITYLSINAISPIISYLVAIPLLLKGYYVIALPLAGLIAATSIEIIFGVKNRKWFCIKQINKQYIKDMLVIALPLMPNFLMYWLFSSCDRLMIAKILGNNFAGVYAAGGKIGQISQLIYTAFAGGWQYFAFSTMKDNDQVEMTSKIFEYLAIITFGAGMLMASVSNFVFKLLFTNDYQEGAIVSPYLFLAPLLLMLFQTAANQFIVIKKTWPNVFILGIGALSNIGLNWILIPRAGIEGAAFATLVGYGLSVFICLSILQHMKLMRVSKKFMACLLEAVLYAIIWRRLVKDNHFLSFILAVLVITTYIFYYWNDIKGLLKKERVK